MFMTLRYGRDDGDGFQCLESTNRLSRPGENTFNSACTTCRRKKLGCSREKTGCRRCLSRGIKCVYATEKIRGKKPQPQADHSVAPQHAEPPPASGIEIMSLPPTPEQETAVARPSLNTQPCRKPSTNVPVEGDREEGAYNKHSQPPQGSYRSTSQSIAPAENPNAADEASGRDTPELACGASLPALATSSSDEYPSTLSDDYFSQFLDPFDVNQNITGSGQVSASDLNADDMDPYRSDSFSLESSLDMAPFISSNLSQGLFASPNGMFNNDLGTTAPPDHMDVNDPENCECTGNALRLLEMVAVQLKGTDWNTTERKLYLLKKNISQCFALSQCGSCTQDSGLAILVLVLYEKMATTFEEIAHWWKRNLYTPARAATKDGHHHHESREGSHQKYRSQQVGTSLGRYQIDTVEEHCKVFATLISLQLHRFVTLVSKMKRNITSSKWEAHSGLLKMLSSRIKLLQATLQC